MAESDKLPKDMGFRQFWWEALKHSFTKAWIGVLAVSGTLAVLVPCARLFLHGSRSQMSLDVLERSWTGWILIVVFFLVLFGRAAFAPFLIYKQTCSKIAAVERERDQILSAAKKKQLEGDSEKAALRAQLDERQARRDFAERLAVVMENGRHLAHQYKRGTSVLYPSEEQIRAWTMQKVNPILKELGMAYVARFNAAEQTIDPVSIVGVPTNMIEDYSWLATRIKILEDFIKELTWPS
jgi:hypothetical protein